MFCRRRIQEGFRTFTDLITLKSRLVKGRALFLNFAARIPDGAASFIVVKRDKEGLASHVIFAIQNIQEEKEQEIKTTSFLKRLQTRPTGRARLKQIFCPG